MPITQPAFFSNLKTFGAVPFQGSLSKNLDPVEAAKEKFAKAADAQIRMIEAAAAKGLWFRRNGDAVVVTLKNGIAAINREVPSFSLANDAQAIKFIKAAKEACARGEFDELLLATIRSTSKKSIAVAHADGSPSRAPAQPVVTKGAAK